MRSHEGFAKFQMSLYFIVDNLVNKMIEDKIVVHEDLKLIHSMKAYFNFINYILNFKL